MDSIACDDDEGWAELQRELVAPGFTVRMMWYALLLAGVFLQEHALKTDHPDERRLIAWDHGYRLPYLLRPATGRSGKDAEVP